MRNQLMFEALQRKCEALAKTYCNTKILQLNFLRAVDRQVND